jgi:AcrR family transcriptional regulator
MTEKQENILFAALKLFANEGYAATSTSKLAKAAGVSEGLIFRHFGNKEGLLQAVMELGKEASKKHFAHILLSGDPQTIIDKMLELPFAIDPSEYEMWRLSYALKWQMDTYDSTGLEPVKLVVRDAFDKLGYADPAAETELLFMLLDGAATAFLLHEPPNKAAVLAAMKDKYKP